MKKLYLTALVIFTCICLPAQRHEKTTDYADEIRFQLKVLEDESISKLRPRDREEAVKRIDEIYYNLNKLTNHEESRRDRRGKHKDNVVENTPMDEGSFNSLLTTMDNQIVTSDRIRIISLSAPGNYYTMEQLIILVLKFTFDDERMKIIELVYPKLVSTENSHLLFNYISFISSKNRLEEIIKSGEQKKVTN